MDTHLRFITAAIKINTDLERMGDLAVNITERSVALLGWLPIETLAETPEAANIVESMVRDSLDAFVKRETELAGSVLLSDDTVDRLRDSIQLDMISVTQKDPSIIPQGVDLILAVRHMERIATTLRISEDVLFLTKGVDVRHHAPSLRNRARRRFAWLRRLMEIAMRSHSGSDGIPLARSYGIGKSVLASGAAIQQRRRRRITDRASGCDVAGLR